MAQFEEASPICRGKNLSWETVLLFYNNMPREAMPKAEFHAYTEAKINGWTTTHSQIARQLAFYYEKDGVCYPRFVKEMSYGDLFKYMQNWAAKYFVPNPYSPSLKEYTPTCIYSAILKAIESGESNFDSILDSIFGINLSSHDKVKVYLNNFTDLIINDDKQVVVSDRTYGIETTLYPDLSFALDPQKYFEYFTIESELVAKSNREKNKDLPLQQIFYGAPGTGKSFEINRITKDKAVIRTTFHPDSDYSTFVGAYKPTSIEVPVRDVTGKVIVENGRQVTENRIVYEFVEQAFLQAYINAWRFYVDANESERPKNQYLVIEEINRGNCAQIFGDLFQLLDRNNAGFSDYPITADKDMKKQLAKAFKNMTIADENRINSFYKQKDIVSKVLNGDILLLPDNLYIWATMNTSDQSLFPIDSAFKRRWDWKYIPISEGKTEIGDKIGYKIHANGKVYDWWTFVQRINEEINEQTKSEDKKLGYFFCKTKNGIIDEETFVSKVIFYLWNDVFKDQEVPSIFIDGEDVLTFNTFFDTDTYGSPIIKKEKVEVLLKNLNIEPIDDVTVNVYKDDVFTYDNHLRVSFPDGTVIEYNTTTDTLVKFVELVGPERIEKLNIMQSKEQPLITKENLVDKQAKPVGNSGYYVITKLSIAEIKVRIEDISEDLGLNCIVKKIRTTTTN